MNTTTRLGKIARLPHSIREQLNLKLQDNLPAKSILPWLNGLPESKAVLAADFNNLPITKQNLSEWKQNGYRDWLLQYEASNFLQFLDHEVGRGVPTAPQNESPTAQSYGGVSIPQTQPNILPLPKGKGRGEGERVLHHPKSHEQCSASQTTTGLDSSAFCVPHSSLTAKLLLWTQLQYISMARHIDAESDPDRKWTALRQFSNDISRLRRSSLADDYLQIQRDWLALSQSNTADKKEKDFWKWTERPDINKKLFPDKRPGLSPEALYEMETKFCLMGDGPGPETAELMAEVRIAKKLLELRKAQEAEARAKADPEYDPNRPLPDTTVRLAGMPFEELFPTIPEKPLTETHPELDDSVEDSDDSDASDIGGASVPASRQDASPTHTPTGDVDAGRECQAQVGLPTTPHQAEDDSSITEAAEVEPASSDSPLPKQEGRHFHNDQNELTEHATRNTSLNDNPTESSPACRAEARRAKAGPGQSSLVQPNPTTPPPDPDVTM